ncbi:hypothetical protein A6A08_16505 [Nocardiopsis sp. TSRI0078]|nr:hypothetical protein A6A08_16505 [Nocardiopsis sp. TSRI0078]
MGCGSFGDDVDGDAVAGGQAAQAGELVAHDVGGHRAGQGGLVEDEAVVRRAGVRAADLADPGPVPDEELGLHGVLDPVQRAGVVLGEEAVGQDQGSVGADLEGLGSRSATVAPARRAAVMKTCAQASHSTPSAWRALPRRRASLRSGSGSGAPDSTCRIRWGEAKAFSASSSTDSPRHSRAARTRSPNRSHPDAGSGEGSAPDDLALL